MPDATTILLIITGGLGCYLLGLNLIHAYFRRKEKFVDTLNSKLKGGADGEIK